MYYFQPGWRPEEIELGGNDLNTLITHLLQSQAQPPPLAPPPPPFFKETAQAKHIGQYIEHMMFALGHNLLDLTITKDEDSNLIFEIINKEK
jgi:hypothetical protein